MRTRFLLIAILLIWQADLTAQCVKGITTNPTNPVNPERPDKTNVFFDWTAPVYNVNSQYISTTQIESPFNQSNNAQVNHFLNNPDRLPIDGWELLRYDMGFNENGTPKTTPVGYVHLVLYNKYTGVLRVFVAGDRSQVFNGAKVEISFLSGKMTSALSNSSKMFALDKFEASPSISAISGYNNNNSKWFYADFNIGYDPCTCMYESSMVINISLINSSTITLSGKFTGELTSITNQNGTVSENGYSFSTKDLITGGQKAHKSYQNASKFTNDQFKALSIEGKTDAELSGAQLNAKHTLNAFQEKLKTSNFLKEGLKAVPYLYGAFDLINFFVAGGRKSAQSSAQEVKVMPMAINASLNLTGDLTANYQYGDFTFYTPGSKNSENKNPLDYPYYNEVLGVFNLLETPNGFLKNLESYSSYDQSTGYYEEIQRDQFQLNPLKYIVNPAAGFRLDNIEILGRIESPGFTSQYLPLSALSSFSVEYGSSSTHNVTDTYTVFGCTPNFSQKYLRLLINLERLNGDTNTQNVIISVVYPIEDKINNSFTFSTSYCEFPKIVSIGSQVLNDVSAWDNVTINPGITFSGNKVIRSNSILVKPGVTLPAGVQLIAGLANGHFPVYVPPITSQSEITAFCSSAQYNSPLRGSSRVSGLETDIEEQPRDNSENFYLTLYPNPSTNHVNIVYFISDDSEIKLTIKDVTGREIVNLLNEFQNAGSHNIQYDLSNLYAGIYLIEMQSNRKKLIKRLAVKR